MYKEIIREIDNGKLKDLTIDMLSMIKETNKELYDTLEMYLYKEVYGCHFNKWLLEKATSEMVNEDGTKGIHWNIADTTSVAKSNGVSFDKFNEYDWCYVMNMMYSDYYGSVNNDTNTYVKMAIKFLNDKDAPSGKALKYYLAMMKS